MITKKQAKAIRTIIEKHIADYTDDDVATSPFVLPLWKSGTKYNLGDRIRYGDKAYKVVQSHESSDIWLPPDVPGLYTEISLEEWPEWKQPTGAQDAYNKGDKVSYNWKHYISLIDGNVWSPENYPAGWQEA